MMHHPRWEIDVLYKLVGTNHTRTHQTAVRTKDVDSATAWGIESLKRKLHFTDDQIEIIKVNVELTE